MTKYNDLQAIVFISMKSLFRSMLEDGQPLQMVQAQASAIQQQMVGNALQVAAGESILSPIRGQQSPVGPEQPPDAQPEEPKGNPFL